MIVTYKGTISGDEFSSPDIFFTFLNRKNFFYDSGQVFAQFELIGKNTYILLNTVKLETSEIEG